MMCKSNFIMLLLLLSISLPAQDRLEYIDKFKDIAIKEMERAGVPASIKLAQGILESNAGDSHLARKANNHFGMKCGSSWKGKTEWRKDDDYDEFGRLQKSCFRAYKNAEESYIAHSEFLRDPRKEHRYGFLFKYDVTDYKRWARGLKRAGYATSANYDKKLISVVESYDLSRFDKMNSNDLIQTRFDDRLEAIAGLDLRMINDAKVVFAHQGDTPQNIAEKADIPFKCIKKWNEKVEEPTEKLQKYTRIYLQPKRKNFRGKKKWHYVKKGEDMYFISQLYGVKLSKLYKRNLMPKNSEPEVNERIKLRGWKISPSESPRLKGGLDFGEEEDPTEEKEDEFMDETDPVETDKPEETNTGNTNPTNSGSNTNTNSSNNTNTSEPSNSGNNTGNPTVEEPEEEDPTVVNPNTGANTGSNSGNTDSPPPPQVITGKTHIVQKGDTLYNISRRYDTTVDALKRLNGLSSNLIRVGQELKVE